MIDGPTTARIVATRRQLHGIAECVMAGPQRRAGGLLTLRVTPGGFATTGGPAVRLDGAELVIDEARRVPVAGDFHSVAEAVGVHFGPPPDGYSDGSGARAEDVLSLDLGAAELIAQWYLLSDAALRVLAPEQTPILWPEHFDVAILVDNTSIGSSPGDDFHARPYAYVSSRDHGPAPYWNAPFGAVVSHEQIGGLDDLVGFWRQGQELLRAGG
ncbi:MAG TPA: hypothetical protein VHM65_08425 [Candidatus Lustribacter sp.]|nr:hypothetical protein [Candidatus Lustribacter sp.]